MIRSALIFFLIAVVAGILGFGVIVGVAATVAQIGFALFCVLLILALLFGRRASK